MVKSSTQEGSRQYMTHKYTLEVYITFIFSVLLKYMRLTKGDKVRHMLFTIA